MDYTKDMTTNTNTARATADEVTDRLAATVARRVAETGESVEVAAARVLADFAAEWPTVAVWVATTTVAQAQA